MGERRFEVKPGKDFDLHKRRVEDVFHGENLMQTILHGHLLIERGITTAIAEKFARPEILKEGRYGRWSFHQKLALYVGLYNPPEDREQMLFAFNRLRNAIAHDFHDDEGACVARCLPGDSETPRPDPIGHVWVIASILFFDLGIIDAMRSVDNIIWDDPEWTSNEFEESPDNCQVVVADDGTVTTTVTPPGQAAKSDRSDQ